MLQPLLQANPELSQQLMTAQGDRINKLLETYSGNYDKSNWDTTLNKSIYQHLRKNGIVPKEKVFSDHTGFLQKLCDRGRCVMCLPKNPLEEYSGLKMFQLAEPLKISIYAIWKKSDDSLISIIKLKELIESKLSHIPFRYEDVGLQIEVSEVSNKLLK